MEKINNKFQIEEKVCHPCPDPLSVLLDINSEDNKKLNKNNDGEGKPNENITIGIAQAVVAPATTPEVPASKKGQLANLKQRKKTWV